MQHDASQQDASQHDASPQDEMWAYRATSGHAPGTDLSGFAVEATDGRIGKVDKYSEDIGSGHIVVDTGIWIFGRQVLLPAGTVSSIDVPGRVLHVDRTKDEIKDSPAFDQEKHAADTDYHQHVAAYYQVPRF